MRLGACCACLHSFHVRALTPTSDAGCVPRINVIAARPENDHDPYHHPQSRREPRRAAVFAAQPRRQCRRPDRACRRQRPREDHPAPLHGRRHGSERRRHHPSQRTDGGLCRAVCAGSPDGPADARGRARDALHRPAAERKLAGRRGAGAARGARGSARDAAETVKRRLAALCHAGPRADDGSRCAAAGRADQPSRPRPDRPA